ncbi:MAG: biotin/lipoyl-binding protein, partial [Chloroflexi bacterium]|nr:biotin/lipoyl-binding protein [Chloroflexota bacterium]
MKLRSRRYLSIAGISVLALGLAGFLLLGRGSQPASAAAESVTYSVKKGDLSTDITAGGNLALSLKEDVAFKVSGYVEDVLVSEGESVKKGQVVARLDATPLDLALLKAEDAFAKAERALEDTKEPYSEVDKAVAVASLAAAESRLSGAYNSWASDQGSASKWSAVKSAEADLARARETMAEIESGPDPKDVASAERQLRIAQASLDDARAQL